MNANLNPGRLPTRTEARSAAAAMEHLAEQGPDSGIAEWYAYHVLIAYARGLLMEAQKIEQMEEFAGAGASTGSPPSQHGHCGSCGEPIRADQMMGTRCACSPASASEAVPGAWLSWDEACVTLWKAIEAIKLGNKTDDKLILRNLREAGIWLARSAPASGEGQQGEVVQRHVVTKYRDGVTHVEDVTSTQQQAGQVVILPAGMVALPRADVEILLESHDRRGGASSISHWAAANDIREFLERDSLARRKGACP